MLPHIRLSPPRNPNIANPSPPLQASSWVADKSSRAASALSTYGTHVTADPAYASVTAAVEVFLANRTDVPPAVTADGTTTTFETLPPWYTALPSDIQSYYSSIQAAEISIFADVANAAPRPTAGMGCRGAAGFAAVGALGAGALLL
jgi:hypothetical protein